MLGLLGPNGAGKTTTVRILSTLLRADGGTGACRGTRHRARRAGRAEADRPLGPVRRRRREPDRPREPLDVRPPLPARLGRGQAACIRAAGLVRPRRRRRPGHEDVSGGMRRRLDLASALIGRPQLLFLDEPTTGLDPRSRLGMWEVIRNQVRQGTTLLLTTQYLEEADELADEIAVVDAGKIIARGTADELKSQVGGERIEVVLHDRSLLGQVARDAGTRRNSNGRRALAQGDDRGRGRRAAARRRRAQPRRGAHRDRRRRAPATDARRRVPHAHGARGRGRHVRGRRARPVAGKKKR